MKTKKFGLIIDSRLEDIHKVSTAVNNFCSQLPLNSEEIFGIELCITEAVVNSIKHAYGNTPGNHVEVELKVYPEYLRIKVLDKGLSMSPLQLEEVCEPFVEVESDGVGGVPTTGRGLMIIANIMDDVSYYTKDESNALIMIKNIRLDREIIT